ncbi:hypothetical protein NP233_g5510 [Leucocoprinus birnbaumii]|uniref:RNA helicase n=1 Tax=Leucocoprinus birnbaumii TaxID=56174 RepID=A0AAD5YRT8_9AGAR|nr:hypothetical protein NP233_g5510 [Leucocoprinus birnbaumii]
MPPTRQEYNAKARRSTAGVRKKGKLKRRTSKDQTEDANPNAEIIIPKTEQTKELDKRQQLREELRAQSDNWSSKKKKRLEKYIDKKLKKEERILIFEKLAKSQNGVSSSLLQSSSTLGSGKTLTHEERLEKDEDLQVRHAIQGRAGKRKRRSAVMDTRDFTDDLEGENDRLSGSEVGSDDEAHSVPVKPAAEEVQVEQAKTLQVGQSQTSVINVPVVIGSALRRNEDGTIAVPVVRRKSIKSEGGIGKWRFSRSETTPYEGTNSSFDSSGSAYDSDSGQEDVQNNSEEKVGQSAGRGSDSDDDKSEKEGGGEEQPQSSKRPAFKEWAMKQLSQAKGYVVDPTQQDNAVHSANSPPKRPPKRRKIDEAEKMRGPMGEKLALPSTAFALGVLKLGKAASGSKPYAKPTTINRPKDVEEARLLLPIVSEEQPIMEAIMLNPVVVICGETGSGKTTQVPQFLYEAGFGNPDSETPGMIGITQPRRVAAISMANRVAHELSLTSSQVSYQIRYDATVSSSTSIKFMTDGVLLRELATDFLLSKYSVVVIDEAHERSINTDILIGVLSRVIKLREEMWKEGKAGAKLLRLIIMSATLRVSDFVENKSLFPTPPPIVNVPARQHPVTIHFSRRTSPDYVTDAIKKACKIHARLPPGGILIFLTGQNEITADIEAEDMEIDLQDQAQLDSDFNENMGDADEHVLEGDLDEDIDQELGIDTEESEVPMHVVPLYSLLPSEKQMEVFKPPPANARLVVVATNIAETSLTIPGIKYVIDCGRAKERRYDVTNGIQTFQIDWISKASASQRAGRAGRTGPGHCYRLYSSALFENYFQQFSAPEILRAPIEGVVLQMKNMHIDTVVNFPFPTPPDRFALQQAEKVLTHLGALAKSTSPASNREMVDSQVTDLGRTMALFPLPPRFSRMLAAGQHHQCLPYIIAMVSIMSVGDPFLYEEAIQEGDSTQEDSEDISYLTNETVKAKEMRRLRRKEYFQSQHRHASLGNFTSDILKALSVVGAYEYQGGGVEFCSQHFVRFKAMEEIHKLRAQITNIMRLYFPETRAEFSAKLTPPNKIQVKVLKQLVAAAFIDQIAVRKDLTEHKGSSGGAQYSNSHSIPYRAMGISEDVFLHPSSVLSDRPPPDYIAFQEVVRTSRVFVKGLTTVNPAWLSSLGKSTLCTYSKPFKRTDGTLMITPRFGPEGWELPAVKAE